MRNYAQLNIAIWNDDDFRALTPKAQHLYFLLLSHPTLSYCGVGDWRPKRLAAMANGWTPADVEEAGAELVDRLFIVVDEDTDEYLVRTFIKNDPLMRQRNLGVSMARAYSAVASEGIRGVIVWELRRLESAHPELKSFGADEVLMVLGKPAIDPSVYPCVEGSVWGSIEGSVNPYGKGSVNPKISEFNPSGKGSPKGSVEGSPTPAPSPTPLTTGELSKGVKDGVKGGPGGKGKPNTTNATTQPAPIDPPPQNLDELAEAYASRTRCPKHRNTPKGEWVDEPCRDCQQLRENAEAQKAQAAEAEKQARLQAIRDCTQCDDNGMYDTGAGLARCTHQPPLKAIGGPY